MAPAAHYSWLNARIGIVLAAVAASSCVAAPQSSPHSLQQVQAAGPSVTYDYSGDEELLQASQDAGTFCSQYNSAPGPARITNTPTSGLRRVVFECGPAQPPAVVVPQQALGPNLAYSYRTDEELLGASRTAEAYCMKSGLHGVVSNITPNTDGSKTVTFQCARG